MVDLDAQQLKAAARLRNGSILKGGVGTGKSRTALYYYFTKVCEGGLRVNGKGDWAPMARGRDLYIITTARKRESLEWMGECANFALSSTREASFGYVQVTVDSWNNIEKYKDVENAFFIFDEQRLVGSGAWVKAFIHIAHHNKWILLSATPGDNWMDYIPVFIANGFYKNRTEFIRRHVVYSRFTKFPKVSHYVEQAHLMKLREHILVKMYLQKHTRPHVVNVFVEHDEVAMKRVTKDRWHVYEDRPAKDIAELFIVMRKVANSHPSRIQEVLRLHEKHKKLIVFYNFNYELDALREMAAEHNLVATEWNGQRHQEIASDADSWLYFVQYTAGAEAWNCIETDAIVFYSLNYSYKIFEQAKGRIDRMNTPFNDLYYYVLRSKTAIDTAILKSLNAKKDFNEKDFGFSRELSTSRIAA